MPVSAKFYVLNWGISSERYIHNAKYVLNIEKCTIYALYC